MPLQRSPPRAFGTHRKYINERRRCCRGAADGSCDVPLHYLTSRILPPVITSVLTQRARMNSASSSQPSSAAQARISARIEVLLIVWRIRQALTSLPPTSADPDLTIRRWNHGIARELVSRKLPNQTNFIALLTSPRRGRQWIAISALGLAAATEMVITAADDTASMRCPPITYLLQCSTWNTRRLRFDLFKVNLKTYLSLSNIDPAIFHGLEDSSVYAKWWTWSNNGPGDGQRCPGWWINPSADVASYYLPV